MGNLALFQLVSSFLTGEMHFLSPVLLVAFKDD